MTAVTEASRRSRSSRRKSSATRGGKKASKLRARTERLLGAEIAFIPSKEFSRRGVEEEFLADPPTCGEGAVGLAERDRRRLPPYIASLYGLELLTPVEERTLFRRMNYAKYRANALRSRLDPDAPDRKALNEIERLLAVAEADRERIVRCNLRLVVSIAKNFAGATALLDELISDGNMVLVRSVERFDYSRGFRFSTYATYAVRRALYRSVMRRRDDRRRCGSPDEDWMLDAVPEDFNEARATERLSPINDLLDHALADLNDREAYIIRQRFGLEGESRGKTFTELGRELGVCKERVRQIQVRAIEKLRGALPDSAELWLEDEV